MPASATRLSGSTASDAGSMAWRTAVPGPVDPSGVAVRTDLTTSLRSSSRRSTAPAGCRRSRRARVPGTGDGDESALAHDRRSAGRAARGARPRRRLTPERREQRTCDAAVRGRRPAGSTSPHGGTREACGPQHPRLRRLGAPGAALRPGDDGRHRARSTGRWPDAPPTRPPRAGRRGRGRSGRIARGRPGWPSPGAAVSPCDDEVRAVEPDARLALFGRGNCHHEPDAGTKRRWR